MKTNQLNLKEFENNFGYRPSNYQLNIIDELNKYPQLSKGNMFGHADGSIQINVVKGRKNQKTVIIAITDFNEVCVDYYDNQAPSQNYKMDLCKRLEMRTIFKMIHFLKGNKRYEH